MNLKVIDLFRLWQFKQEVNSGLKQRSNAIARAKMLRTLLWQLNLKNQ